MRKPISSTEDLANKDRLEDIQTFIKRIQEAPEEEAVGLVRRIRSGEAQDAVFRNARHAVRSGELDQHHTPEQIDDSSPLGIGNMVGASHTFDRLHIDKASSFDEPDHLEDVLYCWNRMSISDTSRVGTAIEAFFMLSEKWFLVFSKETIMRYHRDIYVNSPDRPQPLKQAELCCLCATAAMGMFYAYRGEHANACSETLYHTATAYFPLLSKILPLDAIKVSTLLANFNIKNKRTTALAFVEIGLNLCLQHNLNDSNVREPGMAEHTWINHRKTWRTLLFQSLFLSSTLGYISGGSLYFEELTVLDIELEALPMLQITASRELTKLCILLAKISRMDFSLNGQPAVSSMCMMQELQGWHRQLPKELSLAALIEEQAKEKRVSIYYVNLMFLNTTGLLYRRITGRYLRSVGLAARAGAMSLPSVVSDLYVFENAKEGVLAAQQAARIFELLILEEMGIWKCWLVM